MIRLSGCDTRRHSFKWTWLDGTITHTETTNCSHSFALVRCCCVCCCWCKLGSDWLQRRLDWNITRSIWWQLSLYIGPASHVYARSWQAWQTAFTTHRGRLQLCCWRWQHCRRAFESWSSDSDPASSICVWWFCKSRAHSFRRSNLSWYLWWNGQSLQ